MKFKNLKDIQKHLEEVSPPILITDHVKNVLAEEMRDSVYDVVYKAYQPKKYKRRMDRGGLSDVRNMQFTMAKLIDDTVHIKFENLTKGQDRYLPIYGMDIDSMDGEYITDMITDDIPSGEHYLYWYLVGYWSKKRPFVQDAIFHLKADTKLVDGIKKAFRDDGYKVK